jgi:hypothetical protein
VLFRCPFASEIMHSGLPQPVKLESLNMTFATIKKALINTYIFELKLKR